AGAQRNAEARVGPSPAEVGGVDEARAVGLELRHEGVAAASTEVGLEGARGSRKVGRGVGERDGDARHVGAAHTVDPDAKAAVKPIPAEEGIVDEAQA